MDKGTLEDFRALMVSENMDLLESLGFYLSNHWDSETHITILSLIADFYIGVAIIYNLIKAISK